MMVKRIATKGYSFLEMIIVLLIISIGSMLCVRKYNMNIYAGEGPLLIDEMCVVQLEAINQSDYRSYEDYSYGFEVTFNRKGDVLKAQTLHLHNCRVIVSLGTGRMYVKE